MILLASSSDHFCSSCSSRREERSERERWRSWPTAAERGPGRCRANHRIGLDAIGRTSWLLTAAVAITITISAVRSRVYVRDTRNIYRKIYPTSGAAQSSPSPSSSSGSVGVSELWGVGIYSPALIFLNLSVKTGGGIAYGAPDGRHHIQTGRWLSSSPLRPIRVHVSTQELMRRTHGQIQHHPSVPALYVHQSPWGAE